MRDILEASASSIVLLGTFFFGVACGRWGAEPAQMPPDVAALQAKIVDLQVENMRLRREAD